MDHLEMVEKLREKANVSYEDAGAALEKCNWDLLDALLLLEREGKLHKESTPAAQPAEDEKTFKNVFSQLMHGLAQLVRRLNAMQLLVRKNGESRLELSFSLVLLLLILSFWGCAIAAVAAMIFGYRFSVSGLSFDADVNAAMDKACDFVDNVVRSDDASEN